MMKFWCSFGQVPETILKECLNEDRRLNEDKCEKLMIELIRIQGEMAQLMFEIP